MSDSMLHLTGEEAACVFASVSHEKQYLQDDIESSELSDIEKANALKSISICQSVLSKLSSEADYFSHE